MSASGTRHVSVDSNNDIWVSGYGSTNQGVFNLIDGETGTILRTGDALVHTAGGWELVGDVEVHGDLP